MDIAAQKALIEAKKGKKNKYLHSANHALADELCVLFKDPKHFGMYLKMAGTYNHSFLRKLAAEIMDNKKVDTPGKLFSYLIKKYNTEKKGLISEN
ncbi:MAG TPA: hypothetical protein VEA59_03310 [Patescibacteria group bacterium]|nr:hypothetical protein [Patescibacteria group bacterium]